MSGWSHLRPLAARAYLAGRARLAELLIHGRPAKRSFERVCVVAPTGRYNGIAVGAALQVQMLRQVGVDAELIDVTAALRNPLYRAPHRPGSAYVLHCGGPQTAALLSAVLPHAASAWRIGYWAWELPDPPRDWGGFDNVLHEVWAPSRFSRASLQQLTRRPVHVVPHHVPVGVRRHRDWTRPFTVLTFADSRSSLTRKNVAGAIEAFRNAFGDSPRARLILKVNGPAVDTAFLDDIADRVANIGIVREFLDAAGLAALYRSSDALLSLHRAEGFGLPMLEAMAQGIPVVATGWSGNLDFMTCSNAVLVPCRLVPVADAAGIYVGSTWAEPSIAVAVVALRRLAEDRDYYERISAAGYAAVAEASTPELPPHPVARAVPLRRGTAAEATAGAGGLSVEA